MGELIQIKANGDGCTYVYNVDTKKWQKVCDVENAKKLPNSVRAKIVEMKRSTT